MTLQQKKTLGLALGSGGGRGMVHLGVLRALERYGVKVDFVSGSSIGACVGAMFAAGLSVEEMEARVLGSKWEMAKCFFDPSVFGGVVKGERMADFLREWIGVEKFEDLKIPFAAVAADLISGDEVVMDNGDLITAVRASMAVPLLFKPVVYGEALLVDGGIINPVPDDVVRGMGADVVLAVNLDYRKLPMSDDETYRSMKTVAQRSMNIMRHYLAAYSLRNSDLILNPPVADPSAVGLKNFFFEEEARNLIALGEKVVDDNIDTLRRLLV